MLHWIDVEAYCSWCYAKTDAGEYSISWGFGEPGQRLSFPDGTSKYFPTREAAKQAAEEDYPTRPKLTPVPDRFSNMDDIPW